MSVERRISLAIVAAIGLITFVAAAPVRAPYGYPAEVARLRAHFDSVLAELRSANVSELTPEQRERRAVLIGRLASYSAAGRFPHNHAIADSFVPVFRDEHGTMCAMAYLIASTGDTALVNDVAAGNNLATIPALAGDTRLTAWLDGTGLSVSEAARIQPMYFPDPCPECRLNNDDHARVKYFAVSLGMSAATLPLMGLNAIGGARCERFWNVTGWVGMLAGALQGAYGGGVMHAGDPRRGMGYANIAIGTASVGASVWRLLHVGENTSPATTAVQLAPYYSGAGSAGLRVSARFR